MHIIEGFYEEAELYTKEEKEYVEEILEEAKSALEMDELIHNIIEEAIRVKTIFLSKEDESELQEKVKQYEERLDEISLTTLYHTNCYRIDGWKALFADENETGSDLDD